MTRDDMRRIILYLLLYIALVPTGLMAQTDTLSWAGRVQAKLDSLTRLPMFETSQVGLYVYDLTAATDLYRLNHRQRMRPASCEKVVTAIAALHHLGGRYELKTSMLLSGEVRDRVLWGDVCIVGSMDPLLSQGDVAQMARLLQESGVDSVAGVVRLDLTMKTQDLLGWGWCWDDDVVPLTPLTVDRHDRFVQEFMNSLQAAGVRGVTVDRFVQSTAPQNARPLCEARHSIEQVLERMMKRSDNFFAECLFYQLGRLSGKRYAGRRECASFVDVLIRHLGMDPANYQIADGSGLSLYNYVSPELLVRLLCYAWQNEQIRQCLLPSLPIAGVDGTLEKRMRRTPAEGRVMAKTGTVDGISSLSGYAYSPEGHVLVFSIINQGVQKASQGRNWQDKVCAALCGE